jgi:hypothetical protein
MAEFHQQSGSVSQPHLPHAESETLLPVKFSVHCRSVNFHANLSHILDLCNGLSVFPAQVQHQVVLLAFRQVGVSRIFVSQQAVMRHKVMSLITWLEARFIHCKLFMLIPLPNWGQGGDAARADFADAKLRKQN